MPNAESPSPCGHFFHVPSTWEGIPEQSRLSEIPSGILQGEQQSPHSQRIDCVLVV